jgi:GT2 family glycosyltransferase
VPLFSVVTPVYRPLPAALRGCIDSVLDQTCGDWELCLVDDASGSPEVAAILNDAVARDRRVRLVRRRENGGIVAASNDALRMATGRYVAFLDHDDRLAPTALEEAAAVVTSRDTVDYLYTDEEVIDAADRHVVTFRKPAWSPARLRSQNYCNHLSVFRRTLVERLGGLRAGFDGAQDHDLVLRVTEQAREVAHLPRTLYAWRAIEGSTARSVTAKPYAYEAGVRAVQDHCDRTDLHATVDHHSRFGAVYQVHRKLVRRPPACIVVPARGVRRRIWGVPVAAVVNAVQSVISRSTYTDLEVVVVADPAVPELVLRHARRIDERRVRVLRADRGRTLARMANLGVAHSSAEVVVLLAEEAEVRSIDWLETLVGVLEAGDVGLVGPKLLSSDSRVRSAGLRVGPERSAFGAAGARLVGEPRHEPGHFGALVTERECSGVSTTCAALRREVFESIGGLSGELAPADAALDLGMKVASRGQRIVWTPLAEVFDFAPSDEPAAPAADQLQRRWGRLMMRDAFLPHDVDAGVSCVAPTHQARRP